MNFFAARLSAAEGGNIQINLRNLRIKIFGFNLGALAPWRFNNPLAAT